MGCASRKTLANLWRGVRTFVAVAVAVVAAAAGDCVEEVGVSLMWVEEM